MTMESIYSDKREIDVTSIHSINATNDISMNYDDNVIYR